MPDTLEPNTFRRILKAAVDDFAARGFVSEQQVTYWMALLRNAAEREIGSESKMAEDVRRALGAVFQRAVRGGRVAERVPEVGKYTIAMIEPRLRAELDRRILASLDLIKLRRKETIEKTLRRFSGWTTSIPAGGRGVIDKREVRANIGKDLQTVRWERRRVEIDQGHKLVANIAAVVAEQNGAIAGRWRSNWRQAGYDYREDHKGRDGRIWIVRNSWAVEQGLVSRSTPYLDTISQPAQEPFCRCWWEWILSPRRLPKDLLTRKGREWVEAKPRAA
jgi:hypothetical protein